MQVSRIVRRSAAVASVVVLSLVLVPVVTRSVAGAAPTRVAKAQKPLTAAEARALATGVTDKVIVVLRDQFASKPDTRADRAARAAVVRKAQAPLLEELALTGAKNVKSIDLVNAIAATVSPGEAKRLRANPAVAEVVRDEPIPLVGSLPTVRPRATGRAGIKPLPGACEPGNTVQLNPQAVIAIHAANQSGGGDTAQALGYTGKGVTVAFIADGLDINNPDFIRANGQHVFVDYQDFSGFGVNAPTGGAEAFLDASSIAAQGLHTYDVADYGVGLDRSCRIRILGVAPGASLVGLNVFGSSNIAYNSVFLEAINYAVNVDHVNVINESFGGNPFPDTANLDLVKTANNNAIAAGVTITSSTGDAGITNTLGSPGTDPAVISAGATTTLRAYAQTGIGGITVPGVKGWINDNISALSSAGFDQDGRTNDVVAPGDVNWALCSPYPKMYAACTNFSGAPASVLLEGGTSEASPLTAGVAALVIQAYAESHGGTDPSPAIVKQIITSTAQDVNAPAEQQGAGMLNAYQAVLAAKSYPGGAGVQGHTLLTGSSQLNAVAAPGTTEKLPETLTNNGGTGVRVTLYTRTLGDYHVVSDKTPVLADSTGNFAVEHFVVPSHESRLNVSIAYPAAIPATNFDASVQMSLFDPHGKLALWTFPQGVGNYGNAQVAAPAAGTWTALISGSPSADGGTTGPVRFEAAVARWKGFGTVSAKSMQLAAGETKTVTLTVATPATPGDEAGSIVIVNDGSVPAFAETTTVPVTLRSLVPTPAPSTSFTGTLTGGNGREPFTGQTAYYEFDLPAGERALNAQISTDNAANSFVAELVDPTTDEEASVAANSILGVGAGGGVFVPQLGANLHVLAPHAGLWTLIIDFYNQVSGTAISTPFDVKLDVTPATASVSGLPDSAATQIAAGTSVTATVTVTNKTDQAEEYFVDARLRHSVTYDLAPLTSAAVTVPLDTLAPPYLVPSHTTSIDATATAPAPIFFDFSWWLGDPTLISTSPPLDTHAFGSFSSSSVASGVWSLAPFQNGPTPPDGVKPVTAVTSLRATTAAFDPAVSSPTGDLWLSSIDPSSAATPYVVEPGQTITIPVTITPEGTPGSKVSGNLYLADASLINGGFFSLPGLANQASDVASFGYEYTVGAGSHHR